MNRPNIQTGHAGQPRPLLSAEDFERACSAALIGNLWEDNFNPLYSGHVSLSVSEMRYLANMLRLVQNKPQRMCFTPRRRPKPRRRAP